MENYLLDPESVRSAVLSLTGTDSFPTSSSVSEALRDCAGLIVDKLVLQQVQTEINDQFRREFRLGAPGNSAAIAVALQPSIRGSADRLASLADAYSVEKIDARVAEVAGDLHASLADGTWSSRFPGRLILHRFAELHVNGVKYETLANVILDKMTEREVQPGGMAAVLERILEA